MRWYTAISAVCLLALFIVATEVAARPLADPAQSSEQYYIFGYGSLLDQASRVKTNCGIGALAEFDLDVLINNPLLASTNMEEVKKLKACDNKGIRPVRVQGIKRAWNAPGLRYKGIPTGSNGPWATTAFGRQPTFLGANTADKGFVCTGVVYQVTPEQYKLQVQRETLAGYIVTELQTSSVTFLDDKPAPSGAKIAFFASSPKNSVLANPEAPIVQSYVDVWLTGAMQLQKKFNLMGDKYKTLTGHYSFVNDTVANTYDWSEHWVNDRVFPLRPFVKVPDASSIDQALLLNVQPEILQKMQFDA